MSIGKQAMISIVRQDGLRSSFPVSMGSKETCNWPLKTDRMSCMERRRVASLHISLSLSRSVCLHACAVHLLLLLFLSLSLSRYFKQPLTELYSSVTNDRTNRVHESNFRFRDRPAKFVTRFESSAASKPDIFLASKRPRLLLLLLLCRLSGRGKR